METKICKKCGQEKPISEFRKDSKYKDGRTNFCKSCISDYYKGYYRDVIKEQRERKRELKYFSTRELLLELKRRGLTGTFKAETTINLEELGTYEKLL